MFAVNREKKNQGIKFHWCYRWSSRKERIYTFLVSAHSNPIKGFSKNGDTIFWRTHWPISSEFCCWSLISSHHKLPWQYTLVRSELLLQYRKPWVKPKVTWIWSCFNIWSEACSTSLRPFPSWKHLPIKSICHHSFSLSRTGDFKLSKKQHQKCH